MFTQVATYRIQANGPEALERDATEYHRVVATQQGFLGHLLGPTVHEPAKYVETTQWASADDARAAVQDVSRQAGAQPWLRRLERASVTSYGMRTNGSISRSGSIVDPTVGVWLLVRWQTQPGVDERTHRRNELLMHHEAFAPVPGYLGAMVMREVDGPEWMELIGWRSLSVAEERVREILESGNELVQNHMGECAPGAALHYFSSVIRS